MLVTSMINLSGSALEGTGIPTNPEEAIQGSLYYPLVKHADNTSLRKNHLRTISTYSGR